jgi:hypothetical protein
MPSYGVLWQYCCSSNTSSNSSSNSKTLALMTAQVRRAAAPAATTSKLLHTTSYWKAQIFTKYMGKTDDVTTKVPSITSQSTYHTLFYNTVCTNDDKYNHRVSTYFECRWCVRAWGRVVTTEVLLVVQ